MLQCIMYSIMQIVRRICEDGECYQILQEHLSQAQLSKADASIIAKYQNTFIFYRDMTNLP